MDKGSLQQFQHNCWSSYVDQTSNYQVSKEDLGEPTDWDNHL
jgi:hypothetical protein